jgi:hypothetical protein
MQATDDMLITEASRSAAVRTARAIVSTSPNPDVAESLAALNFVLDCRIAMRLAAGATPLKAST